MIDERGLPCNLDAERFVLGSIMLQGNETFASCEAALLADDFMTEAHRIIYRAMKDLDGAGKRIDSVTVMELLNSGGWMEAAGGISYVASLDQGMPQIYSIDAYVNIVRDKSALRKVIYACDNLTQQCLTGEGSSDVLSRADTILASIAQQSEDSKEEWHNPGDVMRAWPGGLQSFITPSRGGNGIQLPWPQLNTLTCGLQPGDMCLVAGRPSHGKSVAGMQIAYEAAKVGHGVAYFSLEMTRESLVRRLISARSQVDAQRMRLGYLDGDEIDKIRAAANELSSMPIWMDFRGYSTPAIRRALKRLRSRRSVSLVVIDHFHLLAGIGREEERQRFNRAADDLQRYAKEFNVPFVILCQCSRKCEEENRAPQLSDLSETTKLEQNADIVLFTYRPEMYGRNRNKPEMRNQAEFILAKQRNGPTGQVPMTFIKEHQRFVEADRRLQEAAA